RGRDGNDQRGEGEHQRRERIHSADEHVMPPDHVAEETDGHHAVDDDSIAEQRTPHAVDEYVRHDSHGRQNRDVHLGMSEKPEQMLPEEWRTAGMRLQTIADHQASGYEKTRACDSIQDEQQARGEEDSEGEQTDAGSNEPGPGAKRHASEGHSFRAQVKGGCDEIKRTKKRSNAKHKDRQAPERLTPTFAGASIRTHCAE